jgi:hypothetical protein
MAAPTPIRFGKILEKEIKRISKKETEGNTSQTVRMLCREAIANRKLEKH